MDNYPPGVTGSEPEICGCRAEDKCYSCLENADENADFAAIPEHVIDTNDGAVCEDCLKNIITEAGIGWGDLVEHMKSVIL